MFWVVLLARGTLVCARTEYDPRQKCRHLAFATVYKMLPAASLGQGDSVCRDAVTCEEILNLIWLWV